MAKQDYLQPFSVEIDFDSGRVTPARLIVRRLSDLSGLFYDEAAYRNALSQGDPVVYEVYEVSVPEEEGQLLSCTTVIHPGKVGREYYFTKGHFHTVEDRAEIYTCIRGEGYLLMTTRRGELHSIPMKPGTSAYIPPHWSHRTLNCGPGPFIFYAVWPGDAGHDYDSILRDGFPLRVFDEGGVPVVKKLP